MTNAETSTLVLKDQAGGYFLVPRETLEQGRVPEERRAEVERLVAEAQATPPSEQDDVQGYAIIILIVAAEIAIGAAVIIGWGGPDVSSGPSISDAATVRAIGEVALGRGR